MMINLRHQTIYNSGNDPLNITKNILIVLAVLLTKKEQKLCSFSLIIPEIVLAHSELNHNVQSEWSIQNESMLSSIVSNINGQPAPNFMLISARCERCCTIPLKTRSVDWGELSCSAVAAISYMSGNIFY